MKNSCLFAVGKASKAYAFTRISKYKQFFHCLIFHSINHYKYLDAEAYDIAQGQIRKKYTFLLNFFLLNLFSIYTLPIQLLSVTLSFPSLYNFYGFIHFPQLLAVMSDCHILSALSSHLP